VWTIGREVAPGAAFGSLSSSFDAVLGQPSFALAWLSLSVLTALLWFAGAWWTARRGQLSAAAVRIAAAPLLWGATLPALALALDALSFWPTAAPLAALGLGLGVLAAAARVDALREQTLGERGSVDQGPDQGPLRFRNRLRVQLAAAAVVLPMALLLAGWSPPSGDEPNYLVVARSLVVDRDLDLSADFAARAYAPFHPGVLSPHYRPGLREGSRYSMHGVGLPLLIAPAYALGSALEPSLPGAEVALPRAVLIILYGVFAWLLYGFIDEIAGDRAARWGTAATVLPAPLLFAPLYLFAEVPAMLLALFGFRVLSRRDGDGVAAGVALAALPFVGVKYIPLAGALWIVGVAAALPARRWRRALVTGAALAAGLALHALFTWRLYGSLSPAAIYLGAGEQAGAPALGGDWGAYLAGWPAALATALGYLLDQKEGLFAYGPHFLLCAAGLAGMWRRSRRLLLSLALVVAAYVGPYALSQQLGGQGPPVRPLMAVLWVLAPALGIALTLPTTCRGYAVLRGGLPALAAMLTAAYAAQPELLPHDYPVATSRLLQNYSPYGWSAWRLFPQWVNVEQPNYAVTALWTAAAVILMAALWSYGARVAGAASGDGAERARGTARHTAQAVVAVCCALVLLHHALVVRTDRHVPTAMDSGLTAWVPDELPQVTFAEPGGVWAAPGAAVDFLITSPAPLESVDVALRTLVPTEIAVEVEGAGAEGFAAPGANLVARLRPGPGRGDDGGRAYHVRLRAVEGAIPAQLLGGEDERLLGVFLQITGMQQPPR